MTALAEGALPGEHLIKLSSDREEPVAVYPVADLSGDDGSALAHPLAHPLPHTLLERLVEGLTAHDEVLVGYTFELTMGSGLPHPALGVVFRDGTGPTRMHDTLQDLTERVARVLDQNQIFDVAPIDFGTEFGESVRREGTSIFDREAPESSGL